MARQAHTLPRQPRERCWKDLQGLVHPQILAAPKLDWNRVDNRSVRYLVRAAGVPWINQLAFATVVLSAYANQDPATIYAHITRLHSVWRVIFPAYELATFAQWDPEIHLVRYMSDAALPHSTNLRNSTLLAYTTLSHHIRSYLRTLLPPERARLQRWAIPLLSPELLRPLSRRGEIHEVRQTQRRKATDAITPHFAQLRGEAHFRWNTLARLKEHYQQVVGQIEAGQAELPLAFSYEEPRWGRLHFLLWDRRHFVMQHRERYQLLGVRDAEMQREVFSPQKNHYFLEFTEAEPLTPATPSANSPSLLWFGDLLKEGLLGSRPRCENPQDRTRRQTYLRSWGYALENNEGAVPFAALNPGVLISSKEHTPFLREAQKRTQGLLFMIDPLFAAATFGLAALDVITTTGARMSELMQISLSPACLHTIIVSGKERLLLKLRPKMHDEVGEYWVGEETKRNFKKITGLLQEHYHLPPGEPIPWVPFCQWHEQSHLFPARPYLFQFNREHLRATTITACLRFLCHGMIFQASDGEIVVLGAHLLRHVFATHLHQVKKVPLDIVAILLHHKNMAVTAQYAAPMEQDIEREREAFLEANATHLGDFDEFVVRAPAELQQQLEEARAGVGVLNRVLGGDCTCAALCPLGFSCAGCIYKVPDPARREEILQQRAWAEEQLAFAQNHRLGAETRKMQMLLRRLDLELEETRLIEEYRNDEQYKPLLQIQRRAKQGSPLASSPLRGQAPADGAVGPVYRRSPGSTG